jgi:hypothetical protein
MTLTQLRSRRSDGECGWMGYGMQEHITKERLHQEFDGRSFTSQHQLWTLKVVGMYPVQTTFSYTVYFDVSGEIRTVRKLIVEVFKWPTWGIDRIINRIAEVFTAGIPDDGHTVYTEPVMNRRWALMDENIAKSRFSRGLRRPPTEEVPWRIRVKRFERVDAEWYLLWVDLDHPTQAIKVIRLICPEKFDPTDVVGIFGSWFKETKPQDGAEFDTLKFLADWQRRRKEAKSKQSQTS